MLVAVAIVPQETSLRRAELLLLEAQAEETSLERRMAAYGRAAHDLRRQDERVMERMARNRFRSIPAGDHVLVASSAIDDSVAQLIDRGFEDARTRASFERPPSALATLVGGGFRIWVIAGSAFSIFIGLVLGSPGEPVVKEVARRLIQKPWEIASSAVQPHVFGNDEEEQQEGGA